jgi:hypothetical protein
MKFKNKFKAGDIICSDRFHNGLCMVVEKYNACDIMGDSFTCQDLVTDHQKWRAYENDNYMFNFSYNWRIATDDDITKYLSRFLDIPLGKVGQFYLAKLTDEGIMLTDLMFTDRNVHLDVEELDDLKRIIDERLG